MKNIFLFPAKQKTAQFFPFIFCFIRELNPHPPLCPALRPSIRNVAKLIRLRRISLKRDNHNLSIPPPPPLCDAVGGVFYYLGSECDHQPEAGNNIYWYPSMSPYLRLFIVGAAEGGERRQTNTPKAY